MGTLQPTSSLKRVRIVVAPRYNERSCKGYQFRAGPATRRRPCCANHTDDFSFLVAVHPRSSAAFRDRHCVSHREGRDRPLALDCPWAAELKVKLPRSQRIRRVPGKTHEPEMA